MQYFFVVGCGRSGTTMLQQALARHPQVAIPPETGFFSDFVGRSLSRQRYQIRHINEDLNINLPIPEHEVRAPEELRHYYEQMAEQFLAKLGSTEITHVGEKTPRHLHYAQRIRNLYDDAKLVLIYRDGRDVALSFTKVPWRSNDYYLGFQNWLSTIDDQRHLVETKLLPIHCVRYEDLVVDPEPELRQVADFLGLEYHPDMAEGSGSSDCQVDREQDWKARSLKKIDSTRVAVWKRDVAPARLEMVDRWAGGVLDELGYERATDKRDPLPWWFFPRLKWLHFWWRVRMGFRLLRRMRAAAARDHQAAEDDE